MAFGLAEHEHVQLFLVLCLCVLSQPFGSYKFVVDVLQYRRGFNDMFTIYGRISEIFEYDEHVFRPIPAQYNV